MGKQTLDVKILGIFRHAKSEWEAGVTRDFDRGLNARGRNGAGLMGDHIRSHGVDWDKVIASPAIRVKDTIDLAIPEMNTVYDQKLYLASPDTIMEVLAAHGTSNDGEEAEAMMVSGHNPGLQELILELVSPAQENELFKEAVVKFPTSAFAVLECKIDSWADLKKFTGKLVHFARPRDLDPELGPEF